MTAEVQKVPAGEVLSNATLQRAEWLTLALGAIGSVWAGWRWGWRGAVGLAIGALLAWVNFRWLKGGVQDFGRAATVQAASGQTHASKGALLKFFGRFGLLLCVVYVILTRTSLPAISVLAGLFASAAGVVVAVLYELVLTGLRQSTSKGS